MEIYLYHNFVSIHLTFLFSKLARGTKQHFNIAFLSYMLDLLDAGHFPVESVYYLFMRDINFYLFIFIFLLLFMLLQWSQLSPFAPPLPSQFLPTSLVNLHTIYFYFFKGTVTQDSLSLLCTSPSLCWNHHVPFSCQSFPSLPNTCPVWCRCVSFLCLLTGASPSCCCDFSPDCMGSLSSGKSWKIWRQHLCLTHL